MPRACGRHQLWTRQQACHGLATQVLGAELCRLDRRVSWAAQHNCRRRPLTGVVLMAGVVELLLLLLRCLLLRVGGQHAGVLMRSRVLVCMQILLRWQRRRDVVLRLRLLLRVLVFDALQRSAHDIMVDSVGSRSC
jgi:hypothetical protein